MAKSRREKNKKIYEELDAEMRNNKEKDYEEKIKNIDPKLNVEEVNVEENKSNIVKKSDVKNNSKLTVIAKEINNDKEKDNNKKRELVVVKKEKKAVKNKEKAEVVEEEFNEPISYTDKLSIEEILRAKLEQQQKMRMEKKNTKRSPNDTRYTPEMMQERIKQHIGVDVRKEVRLKHKDYTGVVLFILILVLIIVIALGITLIFKVI